MTALSSTGSSTASWRRPAIRLAPASGDSDLPNLKAEFSQTPFKRGTVGMARSQDPDSANSQFFICFDDASFLNGKYTVVGEVTSGMDVVDKIKKGSKSDNGSVTEPRQDRQNAAAVGRGIDLRRGLRFRPGYKLYRRCGTLFPDAQGRDPGPSSNNPPARLTHVRIPLRDSRPGGRPFSFHGV